MSIVRKFTTTPNDDVLDAFGNMRSAPPTFVADGQFTYDLQPLLYEQITSNGGGGTATIAHDATNRCALATFTGVSSGATAYMQSYEWHRYQSGRGQETFISVSDFTPETNITKFARYGTEDNGISYEVTTAGKYFKIYSGTDVGDQSFEKAAWNIDRLDGSNEEFNPSGINLDGTKIALFVYDIQALYTGRVRVGFDIDGIIVWCHEFLHANRVARPYIQNANLPIQVGMKATGTATGTCRFTCSAVLSRGGQEKIGGFSFRAKGNVTAADGVWTHLLSVRPKLTFNGFVNRTLFVLESISLLTTGANPVEYALCVGDTLSGTTTFNDVNTTYSAFEYNTAGTTSGTPLIEVEGDYCAASNQVKGATDRATTNRYPITLDAAGAHRALGTLTLLVQGIGGTSACRGIMNWKEIR